MNKYIYRNLLDEKPEYNAWKSDDSFSFFKSNQNTIDALSELCAIEIEMKRYHDTPKGFDDLYSLLNKTIKELLSKVSLPAYMFISEYIVGTNNRIRSYKGIIQKKHKGKFENIELEVDWHEGPYTIIVGMIKLEGSDIDELLDKYFIGDSTCFIIQSHSDHYFTKDFLMTFPIKYMSSSQVIDINYANLIIEELKDNNLIYRIGGDGGVSNTSLQIFMRKSQIGYMNDIIDQTIG